MLNLDLDKIAENLAKKIDDAKQNFTLIEKEIISLKKEDNIEVILQKKKDYKIIHQSLTLLIYSYYENSVRKLIFFIFDLIKNIPLEKLNSKLLKYDFDVFSKQYKLKDKKNKLLAIYQEKKLQMTSSTQLLITLTYTKNLTEIFKKINISLKLNEKYSTQKNASLNQNTKQININDLGNNGLNLNNQLSKYLDKRNAIAHGNFADISLKEQDVINYLSLFKDIFDVLEGKILDFFANKNI